MKKTSLYSVYALLLLSSACTTTRQFSVPKPAPARRDTVVLTDEVGEEHRVKEGTLRTVDGKVQDIPAYLMSPEEERNAIESLVYEDWSCGLRGGALGAAVSVGAGVLIGFASCKDCFIGRGNATLGGGVYGLLLSPLAVLIGSGIAKTECAQEQPATVQ